MGLGEVTDISGLAFVRIDEGSWLYGVGCLTTFDAAKTSFCCSHYYNSLFSFFTSSSICVDLRIASSFSSFSCELCRTKAFIFESLGCSFPFSPWSALSRGEFLVVAVGFVLITLLVFTGRALPSAWDCFTALAALITACRAAFCALLVVILPRTYT